MKNNEYCIYNYIDDCIGADRPDIARAAYKYLRALLQELGLPISISKLFEPAHCVTCLGIDIDVVTGTLSIPPVKLQEIVIMCQKWLNITEATKNQLQSLLGLLLMFISV